MYKVIIVDNLNRDYKPQGLVTMAMSESNATAIATLLNNQLSPFSQYKTGPSSIFSGRPSTFTKNFLI